MVCSAAALLAVSALAQENSIATAGDFGRALVPGESAWQASVNSGYVAGSPTKFDGNRLGDSDAFNYKLQAGTHVSLNDSFSRTHR